MREAEARLIRHLQPSANSSLGFRRGWRRPEPDGPHEADHQGRCRPPPHVRKQLSRRAVASDLPPSVVDELVRRSAEVSEAGDLRASRADAARAARATRESDFGVAYDVVRQALLRQASGPVNVYSPECHDLLVSAFASRRMSISAALMWRHRGPRGLYHVAVSITGLRRPGRRLLAARRWRRVSEDLAELPWWFPPVRMPADAPPRAVAEVRAALVRRAAAGCAWRAMWLRRRIRFVRQPLATYAKLRFGMQSISRSLCVREALSAPRDEWHAALSGRDMIRSKLYYKISVSHSPVHVWASAAAAVAEWATRAFRKMPHASRHSQATAVPWPPRPAAARACAEQIAEPCLRLHVPRDSDALHAYVSGLGQPGMQTAPVVEDKDPSAAWIVSRKLQALRTVHYALFDSAWTLSDISTTDLADRYAEWSAAGPEVVRRVHATPEKWQAGLPLLYVSIKSKYWADHCKVCQKPQHCCVRRIAAWVRCPLSRVFRRCGRALRLALLLARRGGGTESLATAASDARRCAAALGTLQPACGRCGAAMRDTSVCVADASAMFERVPVPMALLAASTLARMHQQAGYTGVLVMRPPRLRGRLWRHSQTYRSDAEFWPWSEVVAVLTLALSMQWVRLGDSVLHQDQGLPIGGPLSPIAAEVVLSLQEHFWQSWPIWRSIWQFPSAGDAPGWGVSWTRYVDDMLCFSHVFCPSCTLLAVSAAHAQIPFEEVHISSGGVFTWLDMQLVMRAGRLTIMAACPERAWVCGQHPIPTKFRIAPYLSDDAQTSAAIRAFVCSSLSRWHQMSLSHHAVRCAAATAAFVMLRSGYPPALVRGAWCKHAAGHRLGRDARSAGCVVTRMVS